MSRKQRGYDSQRIVADYLREWWPYAEPVGAGRPGSDITGCPGLDIEVKARRGFDPLAAIRQLREREAPFVTAFAVLRVDGQGEKSIADWPVVMPLGAFVELLQDAGYGTHCKGRED